MNELLDSMLRVVATDRDAVVNHPLYSKLRSLDDVRTFSEHHVFAVWDFMCLLKGLQRAVTCIEETWRPVGDAQVRRLVNEIVVGEESDVIDGEVCSHFEFYLLAMAELGANTTPIRRFIASIEQGSLVSVALDDCDAPRPARDFVLETINTVHRRRTHEIAASFTLGREQPIPSMFRALLADQLPQEKTRRFQRYLDRHVEVDGEDHGPASMRLLSIVCGHDLEKWTQATSTAVRALRARRKLWDGVSLALTR